MGSFLFLSLIKDAYCSRAVVYLYNWYTKQKEVKPHKAHSAKQKVKNLVACAIFEDIGQVYMQYFYFEKYMLENDRVVAVNMAFMFIMGFSYVKKIRVQCC